MVRIMDYEKKYKEALELARVAAFNGHQSLMEGIFPELCESEDERIRKELIKVFSNREKYLIDQSFGDITVSEILTWLEKQGETVWSEETDDDAWLNDIISKVESGCTLNSSEIKWLKSIKDKINIHYWTEEEIEPIISDYLRGAEHYGGMIGRLRCLKPKSLEKQRTSYTKSDVDDAYLKGLSDAKNELEKQGDSPIKWNKNTEGNKPQVNHSVLMKTTHGIAEGEWKGEYWEQYRWAGIVRDSDVLSWIEFSDLDKQGEQKPFDYENADIQQKDFAPKETVKEAESNLTPLERKVKDILFSFHINADDGISFDGTMAIVHNLITLCQQEQKPAWSEEDEKEYKYVLKFVDNILNNCGNKKDYEHCKRCYDWLKSLKQRIGG